MNSLSRYLGPVLFLLVFATPGLALTNVTSNVTVDVTWDPSGNPYVIAQTIQVYEHVTLTISPGVQIDFEIGGSLVVGGRLVAQGVTGNPITFSSTSNADGVSFVSTAPSATYAPRLNPAFQYDFANRLVRLEYDPSLGYESGSIFEHCVFDGFRKAISAENSLPCIMNSTIRNCGVAVDIVYNPNPPRYKWFFFYNNTVENCGVALANGFYSGWHNSRAYFLIAGNVFRNCNVNLTGRMGEYPTVYMKHATTGLFLINNQFVGNADMALGNITDPSFSWGYSGSEFLTFLEHNAITHNAAGIALGGWTSLLHNYIANNQSSTEGLGGGAFLAGPAAVVQNNTIQSNGASGIGSHGDGIALVSSESSVFEINHNNLGNSVWDIQDLYLVAGECTDTSKAMNVDATLNYWINTNPDNPNPADHVYDQNDDMCVGTVDYLPLRSSTMTQTPIADHPTLVSPANDAYLSGTILTFNWDPVSTATKYMIFVSAQSRDYGSGHRTINRMETVDTTSITLDFSADVGLNSLDQGMFTIVWFVVAGNEDGWSLPSPVRKVTFSQNLFLVSGTVLDENGDTIMDAYVYEGTNFSSFSDENGAYTLMLPVGYTEVPGPTEWFVQAKGHARTYTYPRTDVEFSVVPSLRSISDARIAEMLTAAGISHDRANGTVAGTVMDENGQALAGATVSLSPPSGRILYLDAVGTPDLSLSNTSVSGEFVVLDVTPSTYTLGADYDVLEFDVEIIVHENAVTADALIGRVPSTGPGAPGGGGSSSGGGGGGGCFIQSCRSD